jgi:ligand-binding sensor domain-containing protein
MRIVSVLLTFVWALNCNCGDAGLPMRGTVLPLLDPDETEMQWLTDRKHQHPEKEIRAVNGRIRKQDILWRADTLAKMAAGPNGAVAVGTMEGAYQLRNGKSARYMPSEIRGKPLETPDASPLVGSNASAVFYDKSGALWVGTSTGGTRIEGDRWERIGGLDYLTSVDSILELKDGRILLGGRFTTLSVLNRIEKTSRTLIRTDEMNKWISSMTQDAAGVVWCGAIGTGVLRYDGRTLELIQKADWLPGLGIYAVHVDSRGNFFLGCESGLGVRHADGRSQILTQDEVLPGQRVAHIREDSQGRIWFVCSGGLLMYDGKTWSYPALAGQTRTICEDLAFSPDGKLHMIVEGDLLIEPQMDYHAERHEGMLRKKIAAGFPAVPAINEPVAFADGSLWLGLENGLWSYDGTKWHHRQEITQNYVSVLFTDSRKRLWAGTLGDGLVDLSSKPVRYFSRTPGMMVSYIRRIAEAPDGTLYVGTGGGLYSLKGSEWTLIKSGMDVDSVLTDSKGRVWFADDHVGIFVIEKGATRTVKMPEKVAIRKLELQKDGSVKASGMAHTQDGLVSREFVIEESR